MNDFQFQSFFSRFPERLDCTRLQLHLSFCETPFEAVRDAEIKFANYLLQFYQDSFINYWEVDDHRKPESTIIAALQNAQFPGFLVESYVRGPSLLSKADIQRVKQSIMSPTFGQHLLQCGYSSDFLPYYNEKIVPTLSDPVNLKIAIYNLFHEKRKRMVSYYILPDATASFDVHKYGKNDSRYYGRISFAIAAGCLESCLCVAAESLSALLKSLCDLLELANGYVTLSASSQSDYGACFSTDFPASEETYVSLTCPLCLDPRVWRKICYCEGFGWGNVIGKEALKNILHDPLKRLSPQLYGEYLSNGSLYLQHKAPIDQLDIDELSEIMDYLYDALFPGTMKHNLLYSKLNLPRRTLLTGVSDLPRSKWERIPVRMDEIIIHDKFIVTQHKCTN